VDEAFHPDTNDFWSSPGEPEFLQARFSHWDKTARDLLRAAPEWRKWPLADRNPAARLVFCRVALLGDAAHPMLPFLAQGAAQAIEDAGILAEVLARGRDVEASLRAYQETRLPRAARVQKESRRQATIYHLGGPAAFLRDAAMRTLGGENMLARYDWLYNAQPANEK
jgi:salicylate hydroxylase